MPLNRIQTQVEMRRVRKAPQVVVDEINGWIFGYVSVARLSPAGRAACRGPIIVERDGILYQAFMDGVYEVVEDRG